MPTCDPILLTPACRQIISLEPRSVLDVGVGTGKWGLLVREYAEMWKHQRFYQAEWLVNLIGIEIHHRYNNPTWGVYSFIYHGDARVLIPPAADAYGPFDLAIMIDVLEHFTREDGLETIRRLRKVAANVLISYSNNEQKDVRDNPYEDHLSKWDKSDLPPDSEIAGGEGWGLHLLKQ